MKCINCSSNNEIEGDGMYIGYMKCGDCGFLKMNPPKSNSNIILPDDPMDSFACESCQ